MLQNDSFLELPKSSRILKLPSVFSLLTTTAIAFNTCISILASCGWLTNLLHHCKSHNIQVVLILATSPSYKNPVPCMLFTLCSPTLIFHHEHSPTQDPPLLSLDIKLRSDLPSRQLLPDTAPHSSLLASGCPASSAKAPSCLQAYVMTLHRRLISSCNTLKMHTTCCCPNNFFCTSWEQPSFPFNLTPQQHPPPRMADLSPSCLPHHCWRLPSGLLLLLLTPPPLLPPWETQVTSVSPCRPSLSTMSHSTLRPSRTLTMPANPTHSEPPIHTTL